MIKYSTPLSKEQINSAKLIAENCGIMQDTAVLLLTRNIDTIDKAQHFLNPSKSGFHSPFIMSDMQQGVERILRAKQSGENVLIFGDYDVDGICATTVLYKALKDFGITARYMIPEREQGYGINLEKIYELNNEQEINLIITVDCGVSDKEKIEELNKKGIDVLVTDHHEVPEDLPNCIVIDPKKKGETYPFSALCGAGVAYKLAYALIGEKANDYLDLVALATVADSMELTSENRDIVAEGLKIFNSPLLRLPFMFLLLDIKKAITAQTLAFNIAPKINAGGRMGDANLALSLLMEEDAEKVAQIAYKLNEYNTLRQEGCDKIFKEAVEIIQSKKLYEKRVILVDGKDWQTGFLGIVCVWIVEKYNRPTIVFSNKEGVLKGSARSVDGVNIYDAINSASDLLVAFGGHSQAAGVTVLEKDLGALTERLCTFVSNNYGEVENEKTTFAEWNIDKKVSVRFAKEITLLEPFGVGNLKPYFTLDIGGVVAKPLKSGSPHYSFETDKLEILHFNGKNDLLTLFYPVKKQILVELNYSEFRGKESVKGFLKQIECDYTNFDDLKYYVFRNELKKITENSSEINLSKTQEELQKGYTTLYVLSDVNNMPTNTNGLKTYYFDVPVKSSINAIVISPISIPEEYKKVVYLDKPLSCFDKVESYYKDVENTYLDKISLDREVFASVFKLMTKRQNTLFTDSVSTYFDLVRKNLNEGVSIEQFIFSAEVFLELGFFAEKNGVLVRDNNVKSPLTNSKIYSRIQKIKNS